MMKSWIAAVAVAFALAAAGASAHAAPVKTGPITTGHIQAELVPETTAAAPGSTFYVALRQKIMPGWHTYWRNPGDAGQATEIKWTLPEGWSAGDIVWPTPERFLSGPLMNYVFSDEVLLPVAITVPASAAPGQAVTLTGHADWLVCKDVCVPEEANLTLDVPVAAPGATPQMDPRYGNAIARTLADAPKPAGLKATFKAEGGAVKLSIVGDAVKGQDVAHAYFFPYDGSVIDQAKPQLAERGADGLTLTLPAGYAFTKGKPPATLAGVIALGPNHGFEVTATPGDALSGAAGLGPAITTTDAGSGGGAPANAPDGAGFSLPLAIGFAVLGGLILNLMPCVFPVLSIKAASLVRHAESPARAKAEGIAFLIGSVGTFLILAALLIAAQKAGQAVGWGFQLQSPIVVAVLALLMLLVALNLSGVFEIGTSVQGAGSGLAGRSDLIGALFTGALAVVVAAPCTAPFMAGAIGWALTQPPLAALAVFGALGVGLALPFTLISFVPAVFRLLPKPGGWMEVLRRVLAFPMYGAAAWLAWVFVQEAGTLALPLLFAAAIVLAFAAYVWGASQTSARPWTPRLVAVLAFAIAVPLTLYGARMTAPAANAATASASPVAGIETEAWSPEKVASLRAAGRPVFVDFTAAWCVTCQVNERTALATAQVADAFKATHTAYLKADWTNRNAEIADTLKAVGRSGVPLYLLYDAKGTATPQILPQLLTSGGVVASLNAAAAKA